MTGVSRPRTPESPPPVITDAQLDALLATCKGRTFDERRDTALIRVASATGLRRQEIADIRWTTDPTTNDLDTVTWQVRVVRKGNRHDLVQIGSRDARLSLQRYLDLRRMHPHADDQALWLGKKGALGPSGIAQVLNRRSAQAGLPRLHPHMMRHRFADEWLRAGGSETGLMSAAGWRSRAMLSRYGAANAAERGRDEANALRIGDKHPKR
jgi:site-specific recombinase XerC